MSSEHPIQLTRSQARAIVDDIRETNGGITDEDRTRTPPSVLRALENIQRKLGAAVRTLATNLYTTDTRFIFEMIQNAEDTSYEWAIAQGHAPFVTFTLFADRIIVDSNEDGFSEHDVRAICSTGESTKDKSKGYIGEKGIGFKSVFKASSKVHVQSGPFSFSFHHRFGDSGLGMVTPVNEEYQSLPAEVRTRFTLYLADPYGFRAHEKDMKEIPDTLALFLSKLQKISFMIRPQAGEPWDASYERGHTNTLMRLTKTCNANILESYYHVVNYPVNNLPNDRARIGRNKAEVILAFPVDRHSRPIIKPQYVYSFLPLRHVGYNFLVQSDFITQASREDIQQCAWNDHLLGSVCNAFCSAVLTFCQNPSLQYDWLSYIPGDFITDPFWGQLREKLFQSLRLYLILRTEKGTLKQPRSLRKLSAKYYDRNNQPLFQDLGLDDEIYLSSQYLRYSRTIQALGVEPIRAWHILNRFERYLSGERPAILRISDEDWHTRVSQLLQGYLETKSVRVVNRLKQLKLVPLQSGTLASAASCDIYFLDDESGRIIPNDLRINIVLTSATVNQARRSLFKTIGVKHAAPQFVIKEIIEMYHPSTRVTLEQSKSHLLYLYWNLPEGKSISSRIFLMDEDETPVYNASFILEPRSVTDDLYFETDQPFGTTKIAKVMNSSLQSTSVKLRLLHKSYVNAVPSDVRHRGRSWKEWLGEAAQVRGVPRIKARGSSSGISSIFKAIIQYHQEILLGVLKAYWTTYEKDQHLTSEVITAIKQACITCENGSTRLYQSYLPLPELRRLLLEMKVIDPFPFIVLPSPWQGDVLSNWRFLDIFNVGTQTDFNFFEHVIRELRAKPLVDAKEGFFRLYEVLFDQYHDVSGDDLQRLRKILEGNIFIPHSEHNEAKLDFLGCCVWKGLPFLTSAQPLASYGEYTKNHRIRNLFRDVLKTPNATVKTYICELEFIRDGEGEVSFTNICDIYQAIINIADGRDWEVVQSIFEESELIYIPHEDSWYPPSECVWTDAPNIGGQVGISTLYAHLKELFVNQLSISAPTIRTYIDQIKLLASEEEPNINDLKMAIESLNYLRPQKKDLLALNGFKFLPIKRQDGIVILGSMDEEFFIIDRVEYKDLFQDKLPTLHFSLEDARSIQHVLTTLELDNRFLSCVIQEKTAVHQQSMGPSAGITHEFRQRAQALYRCAAHYGSSKIKDPGFKIYDLLKGASIYESEGFRSVLTVQLREATITAESKRGTLHLDDSNGQLHIFVPRDSKERRLCYKTKLPKGLVRYLEIGDPVAFSIFREVLSTSIDLLGDILEDDGIVQVPDIEPPEPVSNERQTVDTETETEANWEIHTSTSNLSSYGRGSERRPRIYTPSISDREPSDRGRSYCTLSPRGSHFNTAGTRGPSVNISPQESEYAKLLIKVANAARQAVFPAIGAFYLHGLAEALPRIQLDGHLNSLPGTPFGVRSQDQIAHDIKLGAAGELFIFELLIQQNLPGFNRGNWKSTIRKEVREHPEYFDLQPWRGAETADIVYQDVESTLTKLLIDLGYLPDTYWRDATPTYYIEVKSTTGPCENAFFMSKGQYRRMQNMQLPRDSISMDVYAIFRVFNLGKGDMAVRVYLDPAKLYQDGQLQFTAESYSVVPGSATVYA